MLIISTYICLSLRPRVCHPRTCPAVKLLGPCYKTGPFPRVAFAASFPRAVRNLVGGCSYSSSCEESYPTSLNNAAPSLHPINRAEGPVPPNKASLSTISDPFHPLFKVLFIFRSRYLFAIVLLPVFSLCEKALDGIYHPY